jgi:hypothetical protein
MLQWDRLRQVIKSVMGATVSGCRPIIKWAAFHNLDTLQVFPSSPKVCGHKVEQSTAFLDLCQLHLGILKEHRLSALPLKVS